MKRITFLIVIFFYSLSTYSQSRVVFNKTNNVTYLIKYENGQQDVKNDMLRLLARGSNLDINSIRFNFRIRQELQILKRGNNIKITVDYNDAKVFNAPVYEGFEIVDYLLPSNLEIEALLKNKGREINRYNATSQNIKYGNNKILDITQIDSLTSARYSIEVNAETFSYTQQDKIKLQNYINLIKEYKKNVKDIRAKLRNVNDMIGSAERPEQFENLSSIRNYNSTAQQNLQYLNGIENSNFYKTLNIRQNDPDGLKIKIEALRNKSLKIKENTKEIIDNPEIFWHNKGIDMMRSKNFAEAEVLFKKAITENNRFSPSHSQLAVIYYNTGDLKNALDELFFVKKLEHDTQTDQMINDLANTIYDDFLGDAINFNRNNAFDDAIFALQSAGQICTEFKRVRCNSVMDREMNIAVKGKYYILINNADAAIKAGRPIDAESIIDKAYVYRKNNLKFIPERDEIITLIHKLYDLYIAYAEANISGKKYDASLKNLQDAERVCQKYQELSCDNRLEQTYNKLYTGMYNSELAKAEMAYGNSRYKLAEEHIRKAIEIRVTKNLRKSAKEDDLILKIKEGIYYEYIDNGKNKNTAGQYAQALTLYKKALDIEVNFAVKKDINLNNYINTAAVNLTEQYIETGLRSVERNQLKSARNAYNNAKKTVTEYKLSNDTDISNRLNVLKDNIFKQECINAQNSYDSMGFEAENYIKAKQFVSADRQIQKALNFAQQNSKCGIDISELSEKRNDIAHAVSYQKSIQYSENLAGKGHYKDAVAEYIKAGEYFGKNNVKSKGLEHENTFDYIKKQDGFYINYGVFHYALINDYAKSLLLLQELKMLGFNRRNTKVNQTYLGMQLAIKDFKDNPATNWKINVVNYTKNDRYMVFLKRAYKKQWKKLH